MKQFKNFKPFRIIAIFIVVIVFNSCRKNLAEDTSNNDLLRKEFFDDKFVQNNELKKIFSQIKKQDSLFNFLPQLVEKIGFPQWKNIVTNNKNFNNPNGRINNTDSIIFFIPFKKSTSSEILGYLTCVKITDSNYMYRLFAKSHINTMTNINNNQKNFYKSASSIFALFEKNVNNVDSIYIASSFNTFFSKAKMNFPNSNKSDSNITGRTAWTAYSVQTCFEVECDNSLSRTAINFQRCQQCVETWYFDWTDPSQIANWWEGYGSGGSGSSGNTGIVFSSTVSTLLSLLNLDLNQALWLENNHLMAVELLDYIETTSNSDSKKLAKDHLDKMISDINYLNFVIVHQNTGAYGKVWWVDDVWLSNPNNFNLDITRIDGIAQELNAEEKRLTKLYPLAAVTIKFNVDQSFEMSDRKMGTTGGLNDKKDAFRHAYFNAINVRDLPNVHPNISPSDIVLLFGIAHESETPPQLNLERTMDLFNNGIGISVGALAGYFTSNIDIANTIKNKLDNGELKYLKPIWEAKFRSNGTLINPNGDPNFYGTNGTNNPQTATHGITINTQLIPTNQ